MFSFCCASCSPSTLDSSSHGRTPTWRSTNQRTATLMSSPMITPGLYSLASRVRHASRVFLCICACTYLRVASLWSHFLSPFESNAALREGKGTGKVRDYTRFAFACHLYDFVWQWGRKDLQSNKSVWVHTVHTKCCSRISHKNYQQKKLPVMFSVCFKAHSPTSAQKDLRRRNWQLQCG